MKYILALDQGTTSSRAIVFDKKGRNHWFGSTRVSRKYIRRMVGLNTIPLTFRKSSWGYCRSFNQSSYKCQEYCCNWHYQSTRKQLLFGIKKQENLYIMLLFGNVEGQLRIVMN